MTINEIEDSALKLTPKEKAELSFKLLESLENDEQKEVDEAWKIEVERRYQKVLTGEAKLVDYDTVVKEAKEKYK